MGVSRWHVACGMVCVCGKGDGCGERYNARCVQDCSDFSLNVFVVNARVFHVGPISYLPYTPVCRSSLCYFAMLFYDVQYNVTTAFVRAFGCRNSNVQTGRCKKKKKSTIVINDYRLYPRSGLYHSLSVTHYFHALKLPNALRPKQGKICFLDSLFVSPNSVCVVGLISLDHEQAWSCERQEGH